MKLLHVILINTMIFILLDSIHAQEFDMSNSSCGTELVQSSTNSGSFRGGYLKPQRSDLGGAPNGEDYFPILIVFVQFYDDWPDNSGMNIWPVGQPPTYMNTMITNERQNGSNWWDLYNGYDVSDFWHESSRGKLHAIGNAFSVTLPHTEAWYRSQIDCPERINKDIYERLKLQIVDEDWEFYDRWTINPPGSTSGDFVWGRDGKLDMIYVVFRSSQSGTLHINDAEGWIPLGAAKDETNDGYLVYTNGTNYSLYIDGSLRKPDFTLNEDGSGLVVNGRGGICSRELFLEVMSHEHGHYLFNLGHITCSKMAYGWGREFSFSPWDMIKLDYIQPKQVNYNTTTHILGDYSSRYGSAGTTGEIIQVPIGTNEFFLIANRRKVSDWDRRMSGDTLADDPKNYLKPGVNPEYGKGLYIYHTLSDFSFPGYNTSNADVECADGLWNWQEDGQESPIWDPSQVIKHPTFKRFTVSYENDNINPSNNCNNRDGMSLSCPGWSFHPVHGARYLPSQTWYSPGKTHSYNPVTSGTDRIYTNDENYWYSLEFYGDRWDAWNVGYNEIFSPWSSPNTKKQDGSHSNVYIWYRNLNSSTKEATIEIYKVGENSETEVSILHKTPPSRPMGLKIEEFASGNTCYPKLKWNHNMEPDMKQVAGGELPFYHKRYKIYRATYPSMYGVPGTFTEIADIFINENSSPEYVDYGIKMFYCSVGEETSTIQPYPVRYRIKAVDEDNNESVFSDFAQTIGAQESGGSEEGDTPGNTLSNLPKEYSLKQNYPNPFNPTTNIQFDLPKDGFVNLKIYDISGREVATLVNEFRNAGSYLAGFNASHLSSGVYFYIIKAGSFEETKRMVLIK